MRMIMTLVVAALLATACFGARPSDEQCEKACLHRARLFHEDKWAARLAAAPDSERAALEKEKDAEWTRAATGMGPKACIVPCARPGNQERVDCILRATTLEQADACKD